MRMLLWFDAGIVPKTWSSDDKSQHAFRNVDDLNLTIARGPAHRCRQASLELL